MVQLPLLLTVLTWRGMNKTTLGLDNVLVLVHDFRYYTHL